MNRLNVSAYGVEEMKREDMKHVNGGFLNWLGGLIVRAVNSNAKTLHRAYSDIKAEGGITCCDMPFK